MENRLNALLRLALKHNASDIHITNKQNEIAIEMRIDDDIYKVKSEPKDIRLLKYLQYLANLDIGNLIRPQTGQFEWVVDDKIISLRFALIHDVRMDNGVLRILNEDIKEKSESLILDHPQYDSFKKALLKRAGLLIFSGPTGSGKTTTIYTLLNGIKNRKIFTIEDPIEIRFDSYIQIMINENIGLTYDEAIKQVLRHDPDIIMIGEIRDEITAKMAIRAANTGHLVITSLHAGSSKLAIERLLELGVEKGQLRNVLIGIANQRLYKLNNSHKKIAVYESMNDEDIAYYFMYGKLPDNFKDLKKRIKDAIAKGYIDSKEAVKDII